MKTLFFLLIIPSLLLGQEWIGYFEKDTDVRINERIIQYLRDNLDRIDSWHGKKKVDVPYVKTFEAGDPFTLINGYLYQYTIDNDFENVNVKSMKCSYLTFDFKKKEIKDKPSNNDNDDEIKEKDIDKLKEKIKVKHAKLKKHKKPKPINPGHTKSK